MSEKRFETISGSAVPLFAAVPLLLWGCGAKSPQRVGVRFVARSEGRITTRDTAASSPVSRVQHLQFRALPGDRWRWRRRGGSRY